jgi:cytochrome P450
MVMHPDVQAKAKAEIDEVIGFDRLPVLSDQSQLPYVKAVISEVLRYGQVAPQGLPHRLRANDVYKGYFIPKGSIVFPNIRCTQPPPPARLITRATLNFFQIHFTRRTLLYKP